MTDHQMAKKQEIMEKLKERIFAKLTKQKASLFYDFIQLYFQNVALEDLEQREIADLYGSAMCHWEMINSRQPGQMKIRIYNPHYEQHGWQSTHTIVEVAHDDMPFLVDSIRMAIMRMGFEIHLMIHCGGMKLERAKNGKVVAIHPIKTPAKDNIFAEAPIHIEIARQTEPEVIAKLSHDIEEALKDVRYAVEDWPMMKAKLQEVLKEIDQMKLNLDPEEVSETKDFLRWLDRDHFTYLGYRKYEVVGKKNEKGLQLVPDSSLGVLKELSINSTGYRTFNSLTPDARKQALSAHLLIITKTNTKATVHRDTYTDYIGVKEFDKKGELIGEHRFIGLYTSSAYTSDPKDIPFVRRKVDLIMKNSNLSQTGHAAKALRNILETFPRDDLFQTPPKELAVIAHGILNLQERKRIRMFARTDVYRRFVSCLVYVPRERFDTALGYAMQEILSREFNALENSFTTWFSDSSLARIHYVMRIDPSCAENYDLKDIEQKLIEVGRTWQDDLKDYLVEFYGEEKGIVEHQKFHNAFPIAYREAFESRLAVYDVEHIEALSEEMPINMSFYRPLEDSEEGFFHFKLFAMNQAIALSDVLPIFENMGLRVISARPYIIKVASKNVYTINDFLMLYPKSLLDLEGIKENFHDAFIKVWEGKAENDSFNRLILTANLNWREVRLLRVYAKYLRQTEFNYSQPYIESCINKYPQLARLLVQAFITKFDPKLKNRDETLNNIDKEIRNAIEQVTTLDEDKILRSYYKLIHATLRTNYFQMKSKNTPKPYLSLKLNPALIPGLPLPLPAYEIFVCSTRFEGVHLRSSKVARGGIRWSDRPEDFRTEILGLMKAQNVKNAIIVPSGAKGGFVPKKLPVNGTRDEIYAEGVACYKDFIRGLLDLTDNLVGQDIIPPEHMVRYDDDDPYLVVAADKGTATFSDIANAISQEYDFWLHDAFASGGSAGYDHKKMGITARGAWESVKRHFRMLGHDIQKQPFTVVGIGDMSGDVFGNGMLLSDQIKLLAAFDHREIFLDPDPNPAISFKERQRLFDLPRSSWQDYNAKLISKGGGVYSRQVKSITLSSQIKKLFGIEQDTIEPNELIKVLLTSEVDLLWNGGIGTFIKSSKQGNAAAGDRTNDAIRVNADQLQCRVVCEGGNLGVTQLARIEYALNGGNIYTDFIDNSAGVDCSDHEVNIKILFNQVIAQGDLTVKQRDKLLADMTDEVARLVLQDNYRQTFALKLAAHFARENIDVHSLYIQELSRLGLLNRDLEFLPDDQSLIERKANNIGLTIPEMAVLFTYSKSIIKRNILESDLPEDPYLSESVVYAFPRPIRENFRTAMNNHPLKREIIATIVSNALVNEMGFTFTYELMGETGASVPEIVMAYAAARFIFRLPQFMDDIFQLDHKIDAVLQLELAASLVRISRHATRWLLKNRRHEMYLMHQKDDFNARVAKLTVELEKYLSNQHHSEFKKSAANLVGQHVTDHIAKIVAGEAELLSILDIVDAGLRNNLNFEDVARIFFILSKDLELNWLYSQIDDYPAESQWDNFAKAALYDDLVSQQKNLVIAILNSGVDFNTLEDKLYAWFTCHEEPLQRWHIMIANIKSAGSVSMTMITVAIRALADLTQLSQKLVCSIPNYRNNNKNSAKAKQKDKK